MMTIRGATEADAESIGRIFSSSIRELAKDYYNALQIESWAGGFSIEQVLERIRLGGTYVAEFDGVIAGFGTIVLSRGEVEMVYVSPDYARKGVGAALVRFLEEIALDAGVKLLHLRGSLNAVPFYVHMGYVITEKTIHCNAQGIEFDCTIMEKHLV